MGWNPLKDIKKGLKKIEDSVNQDVLDDVLGVENVGSFIGGTMLGIDPATSGTRSNKTRVDDKIDRATVSAKKAIADAQTARDMPTILANQARAARRKRMRDQSLLAGGASAGGAGGAALSSVMAMGKQSLGA